MNSLNLINKSECEINSVIEFMPTAIIWLDDQLNIKNINKQFMTLLNTSKEKSVGTNLNEFPFHNLIQFFENYDLLKDRDLNIFDSFNVLDLKISVRFYVKEVKSLKSFLIIGIDITNDFFRNDLHEQLKIQQEESARFMLIGQIASGMSHEINNPLTIITGYLNYMRKNLEINGKVDDVKIFLDRINKSLKSAERISKIVWGLKCLIKDDLNLPVENVYVHELVSGAVELCSDKFITNKVKIIIEDLDPETIIECNRIQIIHVIFNLLINSLYAIKSDEEKWVKISFHFDSLNKVISIIDSGTGIPQEVVNKMMQPFFTTKDVNEGIGLGLSSSKMIMKNHKGDLLYDKTGPHTKFNIVFKR